MSIMAKLTQREREVVSLLMQGKRRGEIAEQLCITRRTVKAHLDNARCKAGAKTEIELATKVARDGG